MSATATAGTVSAGAIATSLVALWAYANGEDVSEEVKEVWDKTKEKIEKLIPQDTSNESKERVIDNQIKTLESFKYDPRAQEEITKLKNQKNELNNNNNNENKTPSINPQGAIAGAITGINNSDNNFIKDTTNDNIEQSIGSSFNDYINKMEEYQQKQWEREDTAYQRAVEDARKAGINVGALGGNIQPAQSSTNIMSSASNTQFQEIAELIQQQIDNNFSGNQNDKDRLTQGIQMLLMMALMKK